MTIYDYINNYYNNFLNISLLKNPWCVDGAARGVFWKNDLEYL
jgi:hypothetical protein